jgi:hypothetical protein
LKLLIGYQRSHVQIDLGGRNLNPPAAGVFSFAAGALPPPQYDDFKVGKL